MPKKRATKLSPSLRHLWIVPTVFCLFVSSYFIPSLYESYLVHYIKNKTVLVGDKEMRAHGTGFFIQGNSGITYILTNGHVCGISKDGENIYVQTASMKPLPRRIIAVSDDSDLCLIEAVPTIDYLKLATGYSKFETVVSLGFPAYYGFVPSKGEIIEDKVTLLIDFPITNSNERALCNLPKNKIIKIQDQNFCISLIKSVQTTITTFGGNSGSPVINVWGNVVGIIFAANTESNWGLMISNEEINKFLKDF